MGGVFDRLNQKLGDQDDSSGGRRAIDITTLPSLQRQIMRLLLRELEVKEPELQAAMAELPEDKRPSQEELTNAMKELIREGWVIRMGESEVVTYQPNMQRKAPSTLAQSIWGALDAKIEESNKNTPKNP